MEDGSKPIVEEEDEDGIREGHESVGEVGSVALREQKGLLKEVVEEKLKVRALV